MRTDIVSKRTIDIMSMFDMKRDITMKKKNRNKA